jgi:hypothetical protein
VGWWFPFGVAVGVFVGGPAAGLEHAVVGAAGEGEVVDVGAVAGGVVGDAGGPRSSSPTRCTRVWCSRGLWRARRFVGRGRPAVWCDRGPGLCRCRRWLGSDASLCQGVCGCRVVVWCGGPGK